VIRLFLVSVLALAGCAGHAQPPEPQGAQIPVNPATWDYHGNDILPAKLGNN
jgi:hypothetical protein